MASVLTAFKVQGQTAASAAIVTVDVNHMDDNSIAFTLANGEPVVIRDVDSLRLLGEALGLSFLG